MKIKSAVDENNIKEVNKQIQFGEYLLNISEGKIKNNNFKLNQPVILLRNISQIDGLFTEKILIIKKFHQNFLDCKIATLKRSSIWYMFLNNITDWFNFKLLFFLLSPILSIQFPIRSAFAMTINKAQGATLQKFGVFLNDPLFTHG